MIPDDEAYLEAIYEEIALAIKLFGGGALFALLLIVMVYRG